MRQITEQSGQTDKREINGTQRLLQNKNEKCIVQCTICIVQCYVLEQVRLLVADLLNSSHPCQLQSTPTFGVCMRRMIIMEN